MNYVIDSSVAVKWVLDEPGYRKALRFRNWIRTATHKLLAPSVYTTETAHALTRAERQGRITVGEAEDLWGELMTTRVRLYHSHPMTPKAIAISSRMRVGVYDCLYVVLAQ